MIPGLLALAWVIGGADYPARTHEEDQAIYDAEQQRQAEAGE